MGLSASWDFLDSLRWISWLAGGTSHGGRVSGGFPGLLVGAICGGLVGEPQRDSPVLGVPSTLYSGDTDSCGVPHQDYFLFLNVVLFFFWDAHTKRSRIIISWWPLYGRSRRV